MLNITIIIIIVRRALVSMVCLELTVVFRISNFDNSKYKGSHDSNYYIITLK